MKPLPSLSALSVARPFVRCLRPLTALALACGLTACNTWEHTTAVQPVQVQPSEPQEVPPAVRLSSMGRPRVEPRRFDAACALQESAVTEVSHETAYQGPIVDDLIESTLVAPGPSSQAPVVAAAAPSFTSYTVAKGDSLWLIAKRNGVTVKDLATLNSIPADGRIRVGQVLKVPLSAHAPATLSEGPLHRSPQLEADAYTVRQGDTLSGIAAACGTSVQQLQHLNHLQGTKIVAGQKLLVPAGAASRLQMAHTVAAKPSHASVAAPAAEVVSMADTYTVRPGETLSDIAQKCGVKVSDLVAWNHISDPRKLRAGQKLVLRASADSAHTAAPVPGASQEASHTALPEPTVPLAPQASLPSGVPSDDELFDDEVMFSEVGSIPVVTVQPQD